VSVGELARAGSPSAAARQTGVRLDSGDLVNLDLGLKRHVEIAAGKFLQARSRTSDPLLQPGRLLGPLDDLAGQKA
jgi:hypothetical protein